MAGKTAAATVKPATRAYVTLLVDDGGAEDSFKGVVRLAKGLRNAGSAYPLVVAVLPYVPESRRRVLVDELGCVVREVRPFCPLYYSKLRVWEFVEYDQMMYLDAGFQGSLENIHKKFEEDGGPPPAAFVDADMFVYKPSMATASLLLHAVGVMMRMSPPRTNVADLAMLSPRTTVVSDDHIMMIPRTTVADDHVAMKPLSTTVADDQQASSSSSTRQFSNDDATTDKQVMMTFFMAAVAVVSIYLHYY